MSKKESNTERASALGLGLQILSITAQLDNDKEFCDLIKIPMGEFALDGCFIGYPDVKPSLPKRPDLSQNNAMAKLKIHRTDWA